MAYSVFCTGSGLRTITNILQFSLYGLDRVSPVIYGSNSLWALPNSLLFTALHCIGSVNINKFAFAM